MFMLFLFHRSWLELQAVVAKIATCRFYKATGRVVEATGRIENARTGSGEDIDETFSSEVLHP